LAEAASSAAAPITSGIAAGIGTFGLAAVAVLPLALGSVIIIPPTVKPTIVFSPENLANNGNLPSAVGVNYLLQVEAVIM